MGDPAKIFDTLSYAKKLQKAGFSQEQAEVQAETFLSIVQEQLVSKRDLKELETTMRTDITKLETVMKTDITKLETGMKTDIAKLETVMKTDIAKLENAVKTDIIRLERDMEVMKRDIKIWLGSSIGIAVGILSTIIIIFTHIH